MTGNLTITVQAISVVCSCGGTCKNEKGESEIEYFTPLVWCAGCGTRYEIAEKVFPKIEIEPSRLAGSHTSEQKEDEKPQDFLTLISHLYDLALDALDIDHAQVIGGADLELDGNLCTVDLNNMHVCLWDLRQSNNWEVYSVTRLPAELAVGDRVRPKSGCVAAGQIGKITEIMDDGYGVEFGGSTVWVYDADMLEQMCPLCPQDLTESDDFFGKSCQIDGVRCCETCYVHQRTSEVQPIAQEPQFYNHILSIRTMEEALLWNGLLATDTELFLLLQSVEILGNVAGDDGDGPTLQFQTSLALDEATRNMLNRLIEPIHASYNVPHSTSFDQYQAYR
jgi:hypothetical protein